MGIMKFPGSNFCIVCGEIVSIVVFSVMLYISFLFERILLRGASALILGRCCARVFSRHSNIGCWPVTR